jgi:hypothetical protein
MGFKRIKKSELEGSLSATFLGSPIRNVEEIIDLGEKKETKQRKKVERGTGVYVLNSEKIECNYDSNKRINHFSGTGNILIMNNSNKDRIWDVRLQLEGSGKIDYENEGLVNMGNIEPGGSKRLNYSLENPENLLNLIEFNENLEIVNLEKERISDLKLDLTYEPETEIQVEEPSQEEELEKLEEKSEETPQPEVETFESMSNKIQENLDKAKIKNEELNAEKEKVEGIIKYFNKELVKLNNDKVETRKKYVEMISGEIKDDNNIEFEPLISEFQKEISVCQDELSNIEKEFIEIIGTATKSIDDEYDPQIKSSESKLNDEQQKLDESEEKSNEWTAEFSQLKNMVKELKKQHSTIVKQKNKELKKSYGSEALEIRKKYDAQIQEIEPKLAEEQKKLDEAEKQANEWSSKKKELISFVKNLKKEYESIIKAKTKKLSDKNKEIEEEKKNKVTNLNSKITKNQINITEIQAFKDGNENKIEEFQNKLITREKELEVAIENIKIWGEKEKNLSKSIEDLQTKNKKLEKEQKKEQKKAKKDDGLNSTEDKSSKLKKRAMKKRERLMQTDFDQSSIETSEQNKELTQLTNINSDLILLFNKENYLKFTISLRNSSQKLMKNILMGKQFSKEFYNFKYQSNSFTNVEINNGQLVCSLSELAPGAHAELIIYVNLFPKEKAFMGSGNVQLNYEYPDYIISETEIKNLSAYSHAMHAIKKKEKEMEPNNWECSLIFQNNSESDMELQSILILDKQKEQKYIDQTFSAEEEKIIINPGHTYISDKWVVNDTAEPKFFRKLKYTITNQQEKKSIISLKLEEQQFNFADVLLEKTFSVKEIKSFERTEIENIINIKNTGNIPIKAILFKEEFPADFLPNFDLSNVKIRFSSGKSSFNNYQLKVSPNNKDHRKPHVLEFALNIENGTIDKLLDQNEFLEIKYPFNAITPDYKKNYAFPLEVSSFYMINTQEEGDYVHSAYNELNKMKQPSIHVIHERRDFFIGKEIFPGRTLDEFVINIMIKNKSNIEINNIPITDSISKSFEIVSSNLEYKVSGSNDEDTSIISFLIESILPYQEKEIRYYVQNISGENIDFETLESFIFG